MRGTAERFIFDKARIASTLNSFNSKTFSVQTSSQFVSLQNNYRFIAVKMFLRLATAVQRT